MEQCVVKGTAEESILLHRNEWTSLGKRGTHQVRWRSFPIGDNWNRLQITNEKYVRLRKKSLFEVKPRADAGQGGQSHSIPKSAVVASQQPPDSTSETLAGGDSDQLQVEWLLRTLRMIH